MKRTETAPRRCYMLCKPQGYVCACRDEKDPTVLELLPPALRDGLFPLGRLDKYTEGLILLTDDGKLNRRLLDPEHHVQKSGPRERCQTQPAPSCGRASGSRACRSRPGPPGWSCWPRQSWAVFPCPSSLPAAPWRRRSPRCPQSAAASG